MAVTAQFLKGIMAEARPIIERQMNDAKLVAGFREVVANAGGDWGALKALIKAHVEDENDDAGDGKRVKKIVDKADDTAAYADMLDLANMNENNFSASQSYAETKGGQSVGNSDELATTPKASNSKASNAEDSETPATLTDTQEQPETARTEPADAAVTAGNDLRKPVAAEQGQIIREGDAPRETDCQAGEQSQGGSDASCPDTEFQSDAASPDAVADTPSPPPATATLSDDDVPAFIKRDYVLRPHCLHPDLCAGSGANHCWSCRKAMADSEAA